MIMRRGASLLSLPLLLGACQYQRYQSTFSDAATEVQQFNSVFVIFLAVCAVMYVLVTGFLIAGFLRRGRSGSANVMEDARHHESDPRLRGTLIGWAALIGIGLSGLPIASFIGDRSMADAAANPKPSITVTANQWWWDVQYNAGDNSKTLRTANELH